MVESELKEQVKNYWERNTCETKEHLINGELKDIIQAPKFTKAYFDEIESRRIASREFAQPELYRGKRVLEVGVGSGVDFVQWVRNGAEAYGVDLTKSAINHTAMWMATCPVKNGFYQLGTGDAEKLVYPNDFFDMVWSWGCLHHTPNTRKAIAECARVTRPGGEIKLMLYNRWSLLWLGAKMVKLTTGRDIESPGTQAFDKRWVMELPEMISGLVVEEVKAKTCQVDVIPRYGKTVATGLRIANRIMGNRNGFFMTIRLRKRA